MYHPTPEQWGAQPTLNYAGQGEWSHRSSLSALGYGKKEYYETKDDSFTNLETEYPAIVFDDTSDVALSRKPTISPLENNEIDFNISFDESDDEDYMVVFDEISFSCKIIYVDNLKTDSEDENDKVNMPSSPSPEPTIGYFDDLDFFKDFENKFPPIVYNDLKFKSDPLNEPSSYEQRLETIWGRPVNWVHVLNFARLKDGMRQTLGDRLSMVYAEVREPLVMEFMLKFFSTRRMSDTEMGLDVADTLYFQLEPGFRAYWSGSERVIPDKGDLRVYWIEISSDRDFLGPAPSYVHIIDHVRRLCHRMIACSISGRGQGAEKVTGVDLFYLWTIDRGTANVLYLLAKYLFRHAKGRKSGARLSGGHVIGRLTSHFGLVGDHGLKERQQVAAVGAPRAAEDAPAADEGAQAVPAPVQAPQSPPPAP
ncbi:hypothetical protein Tco_1334958 [Tanacetum coccineum]